MLALYLFETVPLALYLGLVHTLPVRIVARLPKELFVGPFFAAATFIPACASLPSPRLLLLPHLALFAALCTLNCLYIHAWEHSPPGSGIVPLLSRRLGMLVSAFLFSSGALLYLTRHGILSAYPAACAVAAALLASLDRQHRRFHPVTLRAMADAALLAPVLFLFR